MLHPFPRSKYLLTLSSSYLPPTITSLTLSVRRVVSQSERHNQKEEDNKHPGTHFTLHTVPRTGSKKYAEARLLKGGRGESGGQQPQ